MLSEETIGVIADSTKKDAEKAISALPWFDDIADNVFGG